MQNTPMKSDKLVREQDADEATESTLTAPLSVAILKPLGVVKIRPFVTFNEWVILLAVPRDSTIVLPASMVDTDYGVVVGVSATIPTPSGGRMASQLVIGDVVYYQRRSVVHEFIGDSEPYVNMKLRILSERNVIFRGNPIEYEIVGAPPFETTNIIK
jgi:co-chaperonin GroES (HSP10)